MLVFYYFRKIVVRLKINRMRFVAKAQNRALKIFSVGLFVFGTVVQSSAATGAEDKPNYSRLTTQTLYLNLALFSAYGVLTQLPEDITLWTTSEKDSLKGWSRAWRRNVSKGPVWDNDFWYFNWFFHPLQGADYYLIARKNNFSRWQSFSYSALVSTFMWEYGWEGITEVPSRQDILITPIVGSALGELFYKAEKVIRNNDFKVWGSKRFGRTLLFAMNPLGTITNYLAPKTAKNKVHTYASWKTDSRGGWQHQFHFSYSF